MFLEGTSCALELVTFALFLHFIKIGTLVSALTVLQELMGRLASPYFQIFFDHHIMNGGIGILLEP